MEAAVTQDFIDTELDLRIEFGTETFQVGKRNVECRTINGNIGSDFDNDGPRRRVDRITVSVFKDEWEGRPFNGQKVVYVGVDEGKDIKMQVDRVRGTQKVSPTWVIELKSL